MYDSRHVVWHSSRRWHGWARWRRYHQLVDAAGRVVAEFLAETGWRRVPHGTEEGFEVVSRDSATGWRAASRS